MIEIEGVVTWRNRMGRRSVFRVQSGNEDYLVELSEAHLENYQEVRLVDLDESIKITGEPHEHPKMGHYIRAKTFTRK